MQYKVYIALGSNIEPREQYLNKAIETLDSLNELNIIDTSPVYQTKPVGYTKQGQFLNMVVLAETDLSPEQLLKETQSVEKELGRERDIRFGPRTIDLDILMFGDQTIQLDHLTVPHPRMVERAFVLVPLKDLNPQLHIEGTSVQTYIERLDETEIEGVELYKKS
ncbi:2-amino-4-hydroxy-6-hydroxymethyldihydropteridine diphosphokinase [Alkalibacillus haloalkaliphilus]|uniref:2-amino-4-hydroxy-6- hydroxymethyldihydropteridine diphosphokinase n=1 Tax=Alkalibacillus haloalkaliphilus TaxID=94136 RepID=UPI002935E79F|nr:2-amino-4-hydroxy-6-hydroxymethyldihydropteridine diphosphokinase [Alkalibacillus haloalkaliphilus]MDV2583228.1 2-amino-4-hydroxy-6-hydroxymethyldihydropteridine diphosphokinase [Alkalibacillus haloalkaliphilus]